MASHPDKVAIEIEFVLEPSDLFRAGLRLARTRILFGLAFSLTFIAGLIIFLLVLDEAKILLQTSPLFVGIPLLAVGGQILRLHASCKQYVRSLPTSQRRVRYSFSTTADSFHVASGESSGIISWNDVMKVVEDRKRFLFYLNKFDARLIPKRALRQADRLVLLRQVVLSRLANRAQLLT